jgi:heat shock protein HslJ
MACRKYALLALVAAVPLGCLDAVAAEPTAAAAKATEWVLKGGRGIPARPPGSPKLRVEGQKLSGSTGCNAFNAAVVDKPDDKDSKAGGRIGIEKVALTRKLCGGALDRVEQAVVRAMEETRYVEQKGRTLTFLSEKRQPLLIWTRNAAAAPRQASAKRQARVHGRPPAAKRQARVRHRHRQKAHVAQWGCWQAQAPAKRKASRRAF